MADYYIQLSHTLTLPDKAAVDYAVALAVNGTQLVELGICSEEEPDLSGTTVEAQRDDIWMHAEENCDIDALVLYIQYLMQKYELKGRERICLSFSASRPLSDAYGGAVYIVSADQVDSMSTFDWQPPAFNREDNDTMLEIAYKTLTAKNSAGRDNILDQMDVGDEEAERLTEELKKYLCEIPDSQKL
jgi:hypothetical protein